MPSPTGPETLAGSLREAHEADPRDDPGLVAAAKRLRMELLQTKADLGRELGNVLLSCRRCNRRVHKTQEGRGGPRTPLGLHRGTRRPVDLD
jgi:hypothetical protein